jgi:hypothetical protein
MQKSPQEIVIESALSKRKPLEASTLEATDSTGEEDEIIIDEKTSISEVPEPKAPGKEFKEKTRDRMDSLTKMLLADTEEDY